MHEDSTTATGSCGVATLVLADGLDDMWLTVVHFPAPPEPGTTFHFRGEVWEVVWTESCGCRAELAVM